MTVKLRKLWLDGVGDPSARFTNVTFDFTDQQSTLDTIVWLRNGGGKTSLLALMFSLVLPGQRDFLGGRDQERCLADYIQTGDTAHVAAEWDTSHGVVVTGAVYEWPDRHRPAEPAKHQAELNKRWYAFQPTAGLGFETLPVRTDGRRSTLEQLTAGLKAVAKQRPGSVQLASTHVEWKAALDSFDIDQATFRYQKQMNRGEGSIDELFKFPTPEAFVDFIVELVVDDDGPAAFASNLRKVAAKVASKPHKELERTFADGAAQRLAPIAVAFAEHRRARSNLDDLERIAWTLQARLDASAEFAGDEAKEAVGGRPAAVEEGQRLGRLRRHAANRASDLRRVTAELWVEEAQAVASAIGADRRLADLEHAGWEVVELLIRIANADDAIVDIDELCAKLAEGAEPLRVIRNNAADAALARAAEVCDELDADLDLANEETRGAATDEAAASARALDAGKRQRAAELDERTHSDTVKRVEGALATSIAAGVLTAGENPATAAEACRASDRQLETSAERTRQRSIAAVEELNSVDEEQRAVQAAATEASSRAGVEHDAVTLLTGQADALATDARFRELAQTDQAGLWSASDIVSRRLGDAIEDAGHRLVALDVSVARDTRNRTALGDGGLLPPSDDVDLILSVLDAAKVRATHGLAFLAESVNRQKWEATIAAHPGLLAGIVVDDAVFEAARIAAIDAGLHPASLVCISRKRDVLTLPTGDPVFVVPASPALFDRQAADVERVRLEAVLVAYADQRNAMTEALASDNRLRAELTEFLERCPAGTIEAHQRNADEADRLHEAATARSHVLDERREQLLDEQKKLAERATKIAKDRLELATRIVRLTELATQVEGLDDTRIALELAQLASATAASDLLAAIADIDIAQRKGSDAKARAGEITAQITKIRTTTAGITFAGDDTDQDRTRRPDTAASLEALIEAFERSDATWRNEVNDDALAARREAAVRDRLGALSELPPERDPIRQTGDALRRKPAAATVTSRKHALADVTARQFRLAEQGALAGSDLASAESEFASQTALNGALEPHERPATRAIAAELRDTEEALVTKLRGDMTETENTVRAIDEREAAAKQRQETMQLLASGLKNLVGRPESPYPGTIYEGSAAEARADVDDLTEMVSTAQGVLEAAAKELETVAKRLRLFANRSEFTALTGVADGAVLGEIDVLGPAAAALASSYRERLAVLDADLAAIEVDRDILVTDLAGHVGSVLDMLNRAGRTLVLPDSMEAWAGKSFLTVSFERCDDDELRRRLGEEVDRIVASGNAPEGIMCLKRGVHAAVPKGFKANVFKPSALLSDQRHPITRMGGWSGGEKLTAAVLLYCTLAKLRASRRRKTLLDAGAGVLVLDNPLGKASYVGFVALQRRVASDLGVQLVYTTAVRDLGAVGQFPNVIRCRNGSPTGSQRSFVTVEQRQGSVHGIEIGSGVVSSVSVTRLDPIPVAATDDDRDARALDPAST